MTQRTVRIVTGVTLILIALAATGIVLLSTSVVSFHSEERRSSGTVVRVGGNPVRELPAEEGSVQFRGTLYVRGAVAQNMGLIFLFDKEFVSRTIFTDDKGSFTYTLPPGRWALLSPSFPDLSANIRFTIEPPVQNQEFAFEVAKGPVTRTFTFVVHAD